MGKLQHIHHQISAINDLIKINNDRVAGYEKSLQGKDGSEYFKIFEQHVSESKKNIGELTELIEILGGEPATGTTLKGKFYHTWMDIKAKIKQPDDKSILSFCEYSEEVAKAAYRSALDDKELIWDDKKIVSVLSAHLQKIKIAYEKIKEIRDSLIVKVNA